MALNPHNIYAPATEYVPTPDESLRSIISDAIGNAEVMEQHLDTIKQKLFVPIPSTATGYAVDGKLSTEPSVESHALGLRVRLRRLQDMIAEINGKI